jgi:hypothetical protein
MSRTINLILVIVLFNAVIETNASDFFTKLSRTAAKVKNQLLEFFYRFRAFFIGHSESTHQMMTTRGCGYAIDDEPTIYNKRGSIIGKIKGGDDAMWHTW